VVRFLIDHEPIGRGWISSRIRVGKEELIVEMLPPDNSEDEEGKSNADVHQCITPEDSAKIWHEAYVKATENDPGFMLLSKRSMFAESFNVSTVDEFSKLLESGCFSGMNPLESDSFLASAYGKISDILPHNDEIDCPFVDCAIVLAGAADSEDVGEIICSVDAIAHELALESLVQVNNERFPPVKALLARISMLRAINRRARYALPWFSLRPAQESSAVFGGLAGLGSSLERAGRTWNTKSASMVSRSSLHPRAHNDICSLFSSNDITSLSAVGSGSINIHEVERMQKYFISQRQEITARQNLGFDSHPHTPFTR
jgi:hypothetical protein